MDIERWFYALPVRLRSFFHPHQVDQELKEELREHLEQQIKDYLAKGMSPEEARRCALRAMGGITQIEQKCRDARGGNVIADFVQALEQSIYFTNVALEKSSVVNHASEGVMKEFTVKCTLENL